MERKEELKKLLGRLAEISNETFAEDCPAERRRELHRETQEILARIDEVENQRLREATAERYPDEGSREKK